MHEYELEEPAANLKNILFTFIRSTLTIIFLGAGIATLVGQHAMIELFEKYGFAGGLVTAVGITEVAAGLFLLFDTTKFVGSGILTILLLVSSGSHLAQKEYGILSLTLILLSLNFILIAKFVGDILNSSLRKNELEAIQQTISRQIEINKKLASSEEKGEYEDQNNLAA